MDDAPIYPKRPQPAPATRRAPHHPAFESADAIVYSLVGLVFLAAATAMLAYSVWSFPSNAQAEGGFPIAIITLINDLLLVMIIMEVLRTVLSYLAERGGSLRPFLFIAAISATRRILAIGAQMSITGEQLTPARFQQSMIIWRSTRPRSSPLHRPVPAREALRRLACFGATPDPHPPRSGHPWRAATATGTGMKSLRMAW
jgi:uncharacterized membrane protein (DUF373 family)